MFDRKQVRAQHPWAPVERRSGSQCTERSSSSGLLKEAGLGQRNYDAFETYPDEEAGRLVATASRITGANAPAILEDFGEFIAPDLLEMYWALVKPEWKTLDVIEHTEEAIHEVVRLKNPVRSRRACGSSGRVRTR